MFWITYGFLKGVISDAFQMSEAVHAASIYKYARGVLFHDEFNHQSNNHQDCFNLTTEKITTKNFYFDH